ncbi:polysaccharide deacetylase family protein [Lederbergia galactosidilytica]|uniref:polysaccharide deacetylase family protein n=1 Tax=Lederbergia galactosidilytica TaxID=217031 RepID=UPI000AFA77E0|nr:polysaccharide deacetylase family protein [Lederbergia galactosidilytica]MBP1913607.1 putative sporulation protein (polysaccharide deacetylase family) [Lederbergia galactosidilytica]
MSAKNLIAFTLIAILSISAIFNPYTNQYLGQLKNGYVPVSNGQDELYNQIKEAAEHYRTESQDAKIDRVWKAMPGYNGIQVDEKASYQKMKKNKMFDERKLVFIQDKPKIHLADLPPAPIYRGHPDKPMVSFLINVAWGNEYIPSILATLREHKIYATFFLEGRWVKENPELAKMIADSGHEIGNHSYSHPNMANISNEQVKQELIKTNDIIEATTNITPTWFGPPSGAYRNETVEIAHAQGLKTVMWTVDTIDWRKPSPQALIQRVMSNIHPGAMILMHPTESTAKSLDTLITEINAQNLKIGTVTKLMDEERIIRLDGKQGLKQDETEDR